jgi:hypothetical protein
MTLLGHSSDKKLCRLIRDITTEIGKIRTKVLWNGCTRIRVPMQPPLVWFRKDCKRERCPDLEFSASYRSQICETVVFGLPIRHAKVLQVRLC